MNAKGAKYSIVFSLSLLVFCIQFLEAADPIINVDPRSNSVLGYGWPVGEAVTVEIGDPVAPVFTATVEVDGDGTWHLWSIAHDIGPGEWVRASATGILKETEVTPLLLTAVDPANHTISGTAPPGSWVDAYIFTAGDPEVHRHVQADQDGVWVADFAVGEGTGPDRVHALSIHDSGWVKQRDHQEDSTFLQWAVPRIHVSLTYNDLHGGGWHAHEEAEVSIERGGQTLLSSTVGVGAHGNWHLRRDDLAGYWFYPGDQITASANGVTQSHTIEHLAVTGIDSDEDRVSGTADSGERVEVSIDATIRRSGDAAGGVYPDPGSWAVDFSEELGPDPWDAAFDLQEGTRGDAWIDGEGGTTHVEWIYTTFDPAETEVSFGGSTYLENGVASFGWFADLHGEGILSARIETPLGTSYPFRAENHELSIWNIDIPYPDLESLDADFPPGVYVLTVQTPQGLYTETFVFPDMPMPSVVPEVLEPALGASSLDPQNVVFSWQAVDQANFNHVGVFVGDFFEDDIGDGFFDEGEVWTSIEVDPEDFPTTLSLQDPLLRENRVYEGGLFFLNMQEGEKPDGLEYSLMRASATGFIFSTNTDPDRFNVIEHVFIAQGQGVDEGGGEPRELFEFEMEFDRPLQTPEGGPLFQEILFRPPGMDEVALFKAEPGGYFGNRLEIWDESGDPPGDGWYVVVFKANDQEAVCTSFWFGDAATGEPLPMPNQFPEILEPAPGAEVTSPVAVTWEPVTDPAVNLIWGWVEHLDNEEFDWWELPADSTGLAEPMPLDPGPWEVGLGFAAIADGQLNADGVPYAAEKFLERMHTFTVSEDSPYDRIPDKVVLESPTGGEVLETRRPLLSWIPGIGGTSHHVWINREGAAFTEEWVEGDGEGSWTPSVDLRSGDYTWWVRARNAQGTGAWSEQGHFRINLSEPGKVVGLAGEAVGELKGPALRRPLFEWEAVADASWYQVYLNRNGQFYQQAWVEGDTMWQPDTDLPLGSYRWWVRGWNPDGYGDWSEHQAFSIEQLLPEVPVPQGPSGTIGQLRPDFTWTASPEATWQQLWINRDGSNWSSPWVQGGGADTWTPDRDLPFGSYRWWVRGWNPDGFGPWSDPLEFSHGLTGNLIPDGAITDPQPVLTWDEVPEAVWYQLWLTRGGSAFATPWINVAENPGTANQWQPEADLPYGEYRFWVQSWRPGGGAWSDGQSFSFGRPVGLEPEGTIDAATVAAFTWDPVPGATWYDVWVQKDGVLLHRGWQQGVEWSPDTLEPGTYRWALQAWKPNGGGGPWSETVEVELE